MKKQRFAVCVFLSFALLILSSCGISSKKQETMKNSLEVALNSAFLSQDDFVAFAPEVELRNIERGDYSDVEGYVGQFSCSFTDGVARVYMTGAVGFNDAGFVAALPNKKLGIWVSTILVDSRPVPVATSIYNLPSFDSGIK